MKTLLLAVLMLLPVFASAHTGEQSFESQNDKYQTDIGYDLPFQKGQETLIDIALFEIKDSQPEGLAGYTHVVLRIYSGSAVLFERSIDKPEFGKAFATVTPNQNGHWTLSAEFSTNGTLIQSSSFDLLIADAESTSDFRVSDRVIFGVIIVLLVGTILFVFRRKPNS